MDELEKKIQASEKPKEYKEISQEKIVELAQKICEQMNSKGEIDKKLTHKLLSLKLSDLQLFTSLYLSQKQSSLAFNP